jgi:CubicO group peptidase (beta-lactamase class C family)
MWGTHGGMAHDDLQRRVKAAIDRRVADGSEVGAQVAVVAHGRVVVDAVGGLCAADGTGTAVTPATLFHAFSTAKGVASTVAHVLVERGELADDLRAVDVWPELGAHGKDGITLRHVLMHTAGVPAPPYDTTVEDLCDWDRMCALLADAEPWWAPGTRFGYHAQTFGFLLGEIVRRATGKTLSRWLREAVTGPLDIEDEVHFGVPEALLGRVARQEPGPGEAPAPPPGSPADRALPPGIRPDAGYANRRDVLTSDIPSGGTMTARGVARMYSALLGHVPGVQLVSPARLAAVTAVAYEGPDEVMGMPSSWTYGYSPYRPGVSPRPGSTFGMMGMNGSTAYADVDSGVAVAVMRNRHGLANLTLVTEVDRMVADAFPARR